MEVADIQPLSATVLTERLQRGTNQDYARTGSEQRSDIVTPIRKWKHEFLRQLCGTWSWYKLVAIAHYA